MFKKNRYTEKKSRPLISYQIDNKEDNQNQMIDSMFNVKRSNFNKSFVKIESGSNQKQKVNEPNPLPDIRLNATSVSILEKNNKKMQTPFPFLQIKEENPDNDDDNLCLNAQYEKHTDT